ncbi:MAG TPA: hypothetical protein VLH10_19940 [Yinghuangia sp.]|nr:hypothetical protein [Yinghuangia sp.]
MFAAHPRQQLVREQYLALRLFLPCAALGLRLDQSGGQSGGR